MSRGTDDAAQQRAAEPECLRDAEELPVVFVDYLFERTSESGEQSLFLAVMDRSGGYVGATVTKRGPDGGDKWLTANPRSPRLCELYSAP